MGNAVQTNFSHTYAGKEVTIPLFYQPQEDGDDIFGIYNVMHVADKKNLYIPGTLQKILKKYSSCGFSATGNLEIADREISTEKVKVNLDQCEDVWTDTVFAEALKKGVEIDDLTDTVVEDIIMRKVMDALRTDIPRIQWFAENGATSDDYDMFDGWLQLSLDSSGDLGLYYFMGNNSSIETSDTDDTLVSDGAITAFRYLWTNQSKTLRAVNRRVKKFYVTPELMDNYLETLEDTSNELGQKNLEDGKAFVNFRGTEVIEVPGWGTHLADADNPQATRIGQNLVVLTMPENLIVGSDITSPFNEIKMWNSEDNEKLRTKVKLKLGAQILHPEFMAIGY